MISRTGLTKPALVLLCCMGTWLFIHTSPVPTPTPTDCEVQLILRNLRNRSIRLLQDYMVEETWMLTHQARVNQKYPLPCFSPGPEASSNISVIQAYLRKTNKTDPEVLEQLDKLKYRDTPETLGTASAELSDAFEWKSFIVAVLQQFSDCMATAHEAFTKGLGHRGTPC